MGVISKMHPIDQRLYEMGIGLPLPTQPAGNYLPAVAHGNMLFISGQFPVINGGLVFCGQVGGELNEREGYEAARVATLNALTHIRMHTNEWRLFDRVLKIEGFVSSSPHWHNQPRVLDGASDLINEILGPDSGHCRSVLAQAQLPGNAAVEVVVTAALVERNNRTR